MNIDPPDICTCAADSTANVYGFAPTGYVQGGLNLFTVEAALSNEGITLLGGGLYGTVTVYPTAP
jgi:hypothetical protein